MQIDLQQVAAIVGGIATIQTGIFHFLIKWHMRACGDKGCQAAIKAAQVSAPAPEAPAKVVTQ